MTTTNSHHSVPPPPSTYAQFVQTVFVLFALTAKVGDITRISCGRVERSQQFESSSLGIKRFLSVYQGRDHCSIEAVQYSAGPGDQGGHVISIFLKQN